MMKTFIACACTAALLASAVVQAQPGAAVPDWAAQPAHAWRAPSHMALLGAARAGSRMVAVGEHGLVLLSDDDGHSWRQAQRVPLDATLSAVTFVDPKHGWAVGQWGAILATDDGGQTWREQRLDATVDQPLFSVAFTSERDGYAVGLWSLLLETHDGGRSWTKSTLPRAAGRAKADLNLYSVFGDRQGAVYIAAEQGRVAKTVDGGHSWSWLDTGGKGSLWSGMAGSNGRVVVGGLLGSLFESRDGGATWTPLHAGATGSITSLAEVDGRLLGVGLDGTVLRERAGTNELEAEQRPDRAALTAALLDEHGQPVLFSMSGVLTRP